MEKTILVCDNCGAQQEKNYLINWINISIDGIQVVPIGREPQENLSFCSWHCVLEHAKKKLNER